MNNTIYGISRDGDSILAHSGTYVREEAEALAISEGVKFVVWYHIPTKLPPGKTLQDLRTEMDTIMGRRPWE